MEKKTVRLARITALLTIASLVSKLLGMFRDSFIAAKFGASPLTDVFFLSNTIITLIASLITQANNSVMIPELVRAEHLGGMIEKKRFASNMLSIMFLLSSLVTLICFIVSPYIIQLVAPGFDYEEKKLATVLLQIGLPVVVLSSITGVNIAYLQSCKRYIETALNDLILNVIYIISIVFAADRYGIYVLSCAIVVGHLLQLLFQQPGLRRVGFQYSAILDLKDSRLRHVIGLAIPIFISSGISDINKLVDKAMASTLPAGSISALNYAGKINTLVLGVFIVSITTAIFPFLSEAAGKSDMPTFKKTLKSGFGSVFILTVPSAVCLVAVGRLVIQILFERGKFDAAATQLTTECLTFYSLALIGMSLRLLMIKAFYALQDTKTPVINGVVCVCVNIILNIILVKYLAHVGLALATAISSIVLAAIMIYSLRKKIGDFYLSTIALTFLKIAAASCVMGLMLHFLYTRCLICFCLSFYSRCLCLGGMALLGGVIYIIILRLLRVEELDAVLQQLRKKIKR